VGERVITAPENSRKKKVFYLKVFSMSIYIYTDNCTVYRSVSPQQVNKDHVKHFKKKDLLFFRVCTLECRQKPNIQFLFVQTFKPNEKRK